MRAEKTGPERLQKRGAGGGRGRREGRRRGRKEQRGEGFLRGICPLKLFIWELFEDGLAVFIYIFH